MTAPMPAGRARGQRAAGMAMLGSSIALFTVAALAYAGVLPFDPSVRSWVALGVGLAAILDVVVAIFFLRASSQS